MRNSALAFVCVMIIGCGNGSLTVTKPSPPATPEKSAVAPGVQKVVEEPSTEVTKPKEPAVKNADTVEPAKDVKDQ